MVISSTEQLASAARAMLGHLAESSTGPKPLHDGDKIATTATAEIIAAIYRLQKEPKMTPRTRLHRKGKLSRMAALRILAQIGAHAVLIWRDGE